MRVASRSLSTIRSRRFDRLDTSHPLNAWCHLAQYTTSSVLCRRPKPPKRLPRPLASVKDRLNRRPPLAALRVLDPHQRPWLDHW